MPGTIPNMKSVNRIPSVGSKRKRFVGTMPNNAAGVLTGTRRSRIGAMGDRMKSVLGKISGNTDARDAQAAVFETASPGKRLHV